MIDRDDGIEPGSKPCQLYDRINRSISRVIDQPINQSITSIKSLDQSIGVFLFDLYAEQSLGTILRVLCQATHSA
jgi:hypothetical protein